MKRDEIPFIILWNILLTFKKVFPIVMSEKQRASDYIFYIHVYLYHGKLLSLPGKLWLEQVLDSVLETTMPMNIIVTFV